MRRKSHNRWLNTRHNNITTPLAETYSDYLMPIIALALNTGMRRGEIFDLRWPDVNLRRKLITIRGEISKSRSTRHIPMSNEAHACLSAWKPEHLKNQLVFPSPTTGFRLNNIYSSWKNLLEKAGINNFRFHDLRHHFASTLVMKGVDLNTVRELLGHSDIKTTLRYAHLAPEHTAAAISMLNGR
jgi:integrase